MWRSWLVLLALQFAEGFVEASEALLPDGAVVLDPVGDVLESGGLEAAWPPLGASALGDEPGFLEHLEVLGDGGQTELERFRQLEDGRLALGEAREDGPPRRISQRREGDAELIL